MNKFHSGIPSLLQSLRYLRVSKHEMEKFKIPCVARREAITRAVNQRTFDTARAFSSHVRFKRSLSLYQTDLKIVVLKCAATLPKKRRSISRQNSTVENFVSKSWFVVSVLQCSGGHTQYLVLSNLQTFQIDWCCL